MDYEGQKLAELLFYWIIIGFGGVGWVIGHFQQDFMIVFKFWLVGVAISLVVSACVCVCVGGSVCLLRDGDEDGRLLTMGCFVRRRCTARC